MKTLFFRHLQVLFDTLGRMVKSPLPNIMAIAVLGIAISLPLMLFKMSQSLGEVSADWQGSPKINVFLNPGDIENADSSDDYGINFAQTMLQKPSIADVAYISADQALKDFKTNSGFGELLDDLPDNPLPAMLIITAEDALTDTEFSLLAEQISLMPEVASISHDQQWLKRLNSIKSLIENAVAILSLLMAMGVILIISNTVRLGILDRSEEIEVIDQIGGTVGFIRRPFLYFGILQGVAGALSALLIASVALLLLGKPVAELAQQYDSHLRISWISPKLFVAVIFATAILGWLAARLTVGSYMRKLRASVLGK